MLSHIKKIIIVFLSGFILSCSSTDFHLKKEARVDTLSLCLNYDRLEVPAEIKDSFDRAVSRVVNRFNSESHLFDVATCDNPQKDALRLNVNNTTLVSSGEQVKATLISLAGLSLPVIMVAAEVPFFVYFYYFPDVKSNVYLRLSNDLTNKQKSHPKPVANSGYLRGRSKQIRNHGEAFEKVLYKTLKNFEKQYEDVLKAE